MFFIELGNLMLQLKHVLTDLPESFNRRPIKLLRRLRIPADQLSQDLLKKETSRAEFTVRLNLAQPPRNIGQTIGKRVLQRELPSRNASSVELHSGVLLLRLQVSTHLGHSLLKVHVGGNPQPRHISFCRHRVSRALLV